MLRAAIVLAMLCAMLAPWAAAAQDYRKEPLRIPFAAAGRART